MTFKYTHTLTHDGNKLTKDRLKKGAFSGIDRRYCPGMGGECSVKCPSLGPLWSFLEALGLVDSRGHRKHTLVPGHTYSSNLQEPR